MINENRINKSNVLLKIRLVDYKVLAKPIISDILIIDDTMMSAM